MALKDPQELLKLFNDAHVKIQGKEPLNAVDRRKIYDDLTEVYNYVSATTRKPSLTNTLYTVSAQNNQVEQQFAREKKLLEDIQKFVQDNFEKAKQYLRAMQLGGYAAFFALWSITRDSLSPVWGSLAAVLMLISVVTFVIWEVSKATILTFSLKSYANLVGRRIEEFIKVKVSERTRQESAVMVLAKSRATFWIVSIAPALFGVGILLVQLLVSISRGISG
ncbi:MAG: hypothetical protein KA801_02165 [Syntrophorhabdaceae bacterium]|nr:hypothetical protein [Syntrophorhabdaceae bacterium]